MANKSGYGSQDVGPSIPAQDAKKTRHGSQDIGPGIPDIKPIAYVCVQCHLLYYARTCVHGRNITRAMHTHTRLRHKPSRATTTAKTVTLSKGCRRAAPNTKVCACTLTMLVILVICCCCSSWCFLVGCWLWLYYVVINAIVIVTSD